jgi:hypothetical protein
MASLQTEMSTADVILAIEKESTSRREENDWYRDSMKLGKQ